MERPSKKDYHSLLMLVKEHKWLLQKPNELSSLLEFCKDNIESDLICELLNRFCFLYPENRGDCWKQMANQIFKVWNLDQNDTQIVAMNTGDDADSSQAVLQMLKAPIRQLISERATYKNNIDASIKHVANKPYLVIVDEFIGSGDTVKNNIEYLKKRIEEEQISSEVKGEMKIYICVVAAMEHSLPNVEKLADEVFAVHYLKKGISGYCEAPQLTEKLNIMLQMESRLQFSPDSKYFPFGYKESETLYGTDEWNAVNNLFPIFWWEKRKDGKKRTPLFIRG
jgi:hypothetical protein